MAELADAQDLGSCAFWRAGSSPAPRIPLRETGGKRVNWVPPIVNHPGKLIGIF